MVGRHHLNVFIRRADAVGVVIHERQILDIGPGCAADLVHVDRSPGSTRRATTGHRSHGPDLLGRSRLHRHTFVRTGLETGPIQNKIRQLRNFAQIRAAVQLAVLDCDAIAVATRRDVGVLAGNACGRVAVNDVGHDTTAQAHTRSTQAHGTSQGLDAFAAVGGDGNGAHGRHIGHLGVVTPNERIGLGRDDADGHRALRTVLARTHANRHGVDAGIRIGRDEGVPRESIC